MSTSNLDNLLNKTLAAPSLVDFRIGTLLGLLFVDTKNKYNFADLLMVFVKVMLQTSVFKIYDCLCMKYSQYMYNHLFMQILFNDSKL